MPTRFERWMRSKLSTMQARTPSRDGPLPAQSRELPVPYSLPAMTMEGVPASWYFIAASKIDITSPLSWWQVTPPSIPGVRRFLMRTLAKVPRIITSWLPRRLP